MQEPQKQTPAVGERRKFPRVDVTCDLKYRKVDLQDGVDDVGCDAPGVMSNISGGGICFVATESHEVGTMLALELALPGFPSRVISFGRVSWCEARSDSRFDVGVEFWWIGWSDVEAQKRIRHFITQALDDHPAAE